LKSTNTLGWKCDSNDCIFCTALCRAAVHRAQCYCPDRFYGNARVRCERPECERNQDCPFHLACIQEKCSDPCNCPPNAKCTVFNHQPICETPPKPRPPPEIRYECQTDGDCASKLACIEHYCRNPCTYGQPCAPSAICKVHDTLPNRLMTCHCPLGTVGNARAECRPRKSNFSVFCK